MGIIENSLHQAETALHEFISDPQTPVLMEKAVAIFKQALDKGCKIISCGNGGSLCDAAHFAEELTGRFRGDRRPLPAMAINDAAYMTCVGNDFSFDQIFARWVEAFGREGDVPGFSPSRLQTNSSRPLSPRPGEMFIRNYSWSTGVLVRSAL